MLKFIWKSQIINFRFHILIFINIKIKVKTMEKDSIE